ncbi:helix-turn-helix domain-containing protein [Mariniflexile litorale]|uniref:Helix-turn-helix domain-containing protein n=1 Tax=Mariniflexile litorale TaxID=3045158 RepID=A0AAU7EH67_9FLAO|nr:helix-turn-helix domain-containing protein [Mariniflexile sp. KMM 9835]MDQ8209978.1 helix-turn-helix domain-containing protein [Mariniflexile sp. KMM 9835]
MSKKLKNILLLILLLSNVVVGQNSNFTFSRLNATHGLSDNQVRFILQLVDGRMVFTTNGNLNIYDGFKFQYIHRSDKDITTLKKYDGHYRVYQSKDSLLWIKDQYKLMCIDLKIEQYIPEPNKIFRSKGVTSTILDFFLDDYKRMWLLTENGLIQPETNTLIKNISDGGRLQDLGSDKNFLYLFYHTGEVICYDLNTQEKVYGASPYALSEVQYFDRTSMVVKGKEGFYQLRNGYKGGFFYFNPKTKNWKTILETSYTLNTLVITNDEKAYVSSLKGIWEIDDKRGVKNYFPSLKTIDEEVVDTDISTLFFDQQGALWIGTNNRGLLYYHPSRFSFQKIGTSYFPNLTSKDLSIWSFAEDEFGKIYLKSNSGYYQYHTTSKDSTYLTSIYVENLSREVIEQLNRSENNIYKNKTYNTLFSDSRNWVWAGTSDGLKLFTPEDQTGKTFHVEDGLVNNSVYAIIEDKHKQLWVTTSNGISKINVDTNSQEIYFTNFNYFDGTLSGEYLNSSALESKDGTLFFGGIDGFNTLSPNHISVPDLPFKPLLRSIRVHGNKIEHQRIYGKKVLLSQATPFVKDITLNYNDNFLAFDFASLNYINPEKTYYRYQMEGVDEDWVALQPGHASGKLLTISYTNLEPGAYSLNVMSSNKVDVWQGKAHKIDITIQPPWWKSTAAYISYLIAFILITSGTLYFYLRYTKEKIEQHHREEILLLRIRNLIDQRKAFEDIQEKQEEIGDSTAEEQFQKPADIAFLNKAIEFVEKNINIPGYTVEELSSDLNMERTGLYKKLTKLLEESPSLFIRNLRLKKAEQLLLEGDLTIAEIADRVGFSSSSYLSKCFREVYGYNPSKYTENAKKST